MQDFAKTYFKWDIFPHSTESEARTMGGYADDDEQHSVTRSFILHERNIHYNTQSKGLGQIIGFVSLTTDNEAQRRKSAMVSTTAHPALRRQKQIWKTCITRNYACNYELIVISAQKSLLARSNRAREWIRKNKIDVSRPQRNLLLPFQDVLVSQLNQQPITRYPTPLIE